MLFSHIIITSIPHLIVSVILANPKYYKHRTTLPALAMNFMDIVRHRGRCTKYTKYYPPYNIVTKVHPKGYCAYTGTPTK